MGENTRENWRQGYGLQQPGQYFENRQTYDERTGPNWRESMMPRANPAVLFGPEDGRVAVDLMPAPVPEEHLHRNPKSYEDAMKPEIQLLQFRGQGPAPELPQDPALWRNEDWQNYFSWVSSDPEQFRMLRDVYERLYTHYFQQG